MSKRQADVSIRLSRPTEMDTVVRKLGNMYFGFYASADYISERATSEFEFIASTEKCAGMEHDQWLRTYASGRPIAFENDDLSTHLEVARSGVGVAALPCFIADHAPELVCISPEQFMSREIWILTHRDARRSPVIRSVIQFLTDLIQSNNYLGGSAPQDMSHRFKRTEAIT